MEGNNVELTTNMTKGCDMANIQKLAMDATAKKQSPTKLAKKKKKKLDRLFGIELKDFEGLS